MISILVVLACVVWVVAGAGFVTAASRRASRQPSDATPLSVLKPLCGADPSLRDNLASFFTQDHPAYQLVFGVEDPVDPALAVVRSLIAEHPQVDAIIVIHEGEAAFNPKVANLTAMLPAARHDRVVISDASVRAPTHYLSDLSARFEAPGVGLVTSVLVGVGEASLGAALDNVQLNGFVAAGTVMPTAVGDAAVVGKSMMMSRRRFVALGGFAGVRDVLAEDFMIGKMFQHAGDRVVCAPLLLPTVSGALSVRGFLRRQLRWSMMRLRLRSLSFVLEPLTRPLFVLPFAWSLMGFWALPLVYALMAVRDVMPWVAMRGLRGAYLPLLLAPLCDLLLLGVWAITPFVKHIAWRGHRVRVGPGTHVFLSREHTRSARSTTALADITPL